MSTASRAFCSRKAYRATSPCDGIAARGSMCTGDGRNLPPHLKIAADPASGEDAYWRAWLRALERLLAARGLAAPAAIDATADAWTRAAAATPHGTPIRLENAAPHR